MANERSEFTNKQEDIKWLMETFFNLHEPIPFKVKSFIFFGNADCPTKICIYKKKSPLITDKPVRYVLQENGSYKIEEKAGESNI